MAKCNFCNYIVLLVASCIFCVLFIVSLVLIFVVIPNLIDEQVKQNTRLDKDTTQYDRFMELPFPLLFSVYIFEIQNPEAIRQDNNDTIRVREKGPYVYNQYRSKNVTNEDDDADTFTFFEVDRLEFNEKLSIGKDDENVTVLNPVLLSTFQISSDMERFGLNPCVKWVFEENYNEILITIPVRKLLFDGIQFSIETNLNEHPFCAVVNWIIRIKARSMSRNSFEMRNEDGKVIGLTFNYFGFKNATSEAEYTIKRGRDDIDDLGAIVAYNNSKYVYNWGQSASVNNETCGTIRGSDSTLYPPNIKKDEDFEIFSLDICRSVAIKFDREKSYKGVDGYLFKTDQNTLRSSLMSAENDCYCTKKTKNIDDEDDCYLDGFIDMSPCYHAPILFSHPHFLWVDDKYLKGVDGLDPDEDKHSIYVLLEPNTGTPLEGMKRIQLNVVLRPSTYIDEAADLKRAVVPLLWVEEGMALEQKYIDEINDKYFDKVKLATILKYVFLGVSVAGTVICFGFGMLKLRNAKREKVA